MATTSVFAECEKNIKEKLSKLKEFQSSLENALVAIQKANEHEFDFQETPEVMLKNILDQSIQAKRQINGDVSTSLPHQDTKAETTKEENNMENRSKVEMNMSTKTKTVPQPTAEEVAEETEKFIENLLCTSGAKVGVKYKIEVTSPLAVDGTFWASNVETGFVTDKLEPLSEKLRAATQLDRNLWVVEDTSKLVCVKSAINQLWMRAKVIKHNNSTSVRVQFVDLGRNEDCPKSRLSKLPVEYEQIPFMAFHCTLSEERVKVQYEIKWKFSDLVKKKVLNFTVQKLLDHGDEKLVFGRLETILDNPPVVVNEQIIPGCLRMGAERDSNDVSIASRDIRVQCSEQSKELTSMSEIIRNNSVSKDEDGEAESPIKETPSQPPQPMKKSPGRPLPPLSPIKIPDNNTTANPDDGWGDSDTPGLDEHMHLSPLDDKLFDSPSNSMGETQLKEEFSRMQPAPSTDAARPFDDGQAELEAFLRKLHQQREVLIQSVPSVEQNQMIQAIDQQLMFIYTQMQQNIPSAPPTFSTQPPPQLTSMPQQQQPPQNNAPYQPFHPPLPIGTRPPKPQQSMQPSAPHPLPTAVQSGGDFSVKMQQLDAITRCLQTPSGILDTQHLQQLQMARDILLKELTEENMRKTQMEVLLQQQHQQILLQEQQLATLPPQQPLLPPQTSEATSGQLQLQHLARMREQLLTESTDSIDTSLSSSTDFLDEISKKTEEFRQETISPIVQPDVVATPPPAPTPTALEEPLQEKPSTNPSKSSEGTIEITHTSKFDATIKPKGFIVPTFETLSAETKSDWIARELLNLENSKFTQPETKFYSSIIYESNGRFNPSLSKVCTTGRFMVCDSDAPIFTKGWPRAEGPIFVITKYKLSDGTWMVGGILEIVSPKITKDKPVRGSGSGYHTCKANLISTAIVNDLQWFRSKSSSREIPRDVALRYIQLIVGKLQEGRCNTVFRFQDQRSKEQQQPGHPFSGSLRQQPSNTQQQSRDTSTTATTSSNQQERKQTNNQLPAKYDFPSNSPSSSYFSEQPVSSSNSSSAPSKPMNVTIPDCEENWDLELNSPTRAVPTPKEKASSQENLGSGDEGERDFNAEIEAFGLSKEDF